MSTVISVENLAKAYRLGQIGTGTVARDLNVWWAKIRGKPNPMLKIGQEDHGNCDGEEVWALKNVSFKVDQGEVLGIIGRNGAGKSTLLKILSRVTAPTSGRIRVKGRVASLLEVGTGFHPDLTGRENIFLNGAILGMTRKEIGRKFDEIVDFAGVEKFIDTPVKRYSSGMYVRLAFAVAAHWEPEILVIDEVLAVGDAEFQTKCLGKMGEVAQGGRTVLFVSHNMGAISKLCKKGILVSKGCVEFDGEATACVATYLTGSMNSQGKTIRELITYSSHVEVDEITVNGQQSCVVHLPANNKLTICVRGTILEEIKMDLEARFYDYQGIPLGFFSPGHTSGRVKRYEAGSFMISRTVELPQITRGNYLMSLFLADPNHSFWMQAPHAVQLIAQGTITATGFTVDYAKGNGWILLP